MAVDRSIYRASHTQHVKVFIRSDEGVIADTSDANSVISLIADSSSVSYDRTGEVRTRGTFTFLSQTNDAYDLVDPLQIREIVPMYGVSNGGSITWTSLGYLRVMTTKEERIGTNRKYTVECLDRSSFISDNKWSAPYRIAAGTTNPAAVKQIIDDRSPNFEILSVYADPTSNVTPLTVFDENDDPWKSSSKFTQADSCEQFFDKDGVFRMDKILDPDLQTPTLILGEEDYSVQINPLTSSVSRKDAYNGVICKAEAPWLLVPVRGEFWDEDPFSATYRYTFGDKPKIISDSVATTQAQCESIADAEFNRVSGVTEEISFGVIKDPHVNVGDVIDVVDSGSVKRYVLDKLNFPLSTSPMTGTMRRKK